MSRRASAFSRVVRLGAVLGLLSVLLVFGRPELALAQTSESGSDNARALPDKGFELDTARWQPDDFWSDGTTMWVVDGWNDKLLTALLASMALLGAACTGTSPEAVDEGQPSDTTAAATTAPATTATTSPPTTAGSTEPAPTTTAVMPPEETLAEIERYITGFEPHLLEVTEAFDAGGLDAAVAMAKPPVLAEYPREVLLVVDDSGHVVYHPNSDLIGVIVDSRFDPSTVGQNVAELLGPDALGHATASGARYSDDSGVDVVLLSTPQGWVVGGGVTGR